MFKKVLLASAVGGVFLLTGCGGSGGADAPAPTPPPTTQGGDGLIISQSVSGPLDPVQAQLSGVLGQLGTAATGTPLEAILHCADQTVTHSTLDIADTVLAQLQTSLVTGGGVSMRPDPATLATSLGGLAANLTQLLQGFADTGGGCLANTFTLSQVGFATNPLVGTPLEPLGTQLGPVLSQIAVVLDNYDGREEDLQLGQVAALIFQLNTAMQTALDQIPADSYETPVVGGVLSTVSTALQDTNNLMGSVLVYNAEGTTAGLQTLLDHTLVNALTNILPVRMIEDQAGQPGVLSGPIELAVAQFSSTLAGAVGTVATPALETLLGGALESVLDPIENGLLATILGPLTEALDGELGGVPDLGNPLAGTPLAPVLDAVTGVLGSLLGGLGGGEGGEGGGEEPCPFAGLPLLSALCGIV
ncbi:MAG: hypothetical protein M3O62_08495 [Pseudomonadota bacterium]|nr:hypothetical protein [Pseudomonadota bacterium]